MLGKTTVLEYSTVWMASVTGPLIDRENQLRGVDCRSVLT